MRTVLVSVSLLVMPVIVAQQHHDPLPKGAIYGIAIGQDGQPARRIRLTASPLMGIALGMLPHARTNDTGEYRFEHLPWWGRYTVYGEDEDAGYSIFSNGAVSDGHPSEVEVTPEHPEAEFKVFLPAKAGFLQVHLTNRRTGGSISAMQVALMPKEKPESPLFTMSCNSNHIVLIPPDKDLLLHVTSDGFREWDESVGRGKPLHLTSGTRLALAVQLEPSD
jgi:hypothetical protein